MACWGSNECGLLGSAYGDDTCTSSANNQCSTTAVAISGITGAVAVSVGDETACAILASGAVECWGTEVVGPRTGCKYSCACSPTPIQMSGLSSGVAAISVGEGGITCAVLIDGTVQCWGAAVTIHNVLGIDANNDTPVPVSGVTGATSISIASGFGCALISDGTIKCWGDNSSGQLGTGSVTGPMECDDDAIPCSTSGVTVNGITNAVAVSVAYGRACTLLSGGVVKCWGNGASGKLGDGSRTGPEKCRLSECSTTPVAVQGLSSAATSIALGDSAACASLSGGRVECWGSDYDGLLGNRDIHSATPVPVEW